MKRLLALAVVLPAFGYGYEKISGNGIGVSRNLTKATIVFAGWF